MAIRRGKVPADEFTIISNAMLRDPRLSWKAKGLLAYIMSHAADYALSTEQIIGEGKDARDAVRAGLRELEEVGVLRRLPLRDELGRTAGYDYEVVAPTAGWSGDGKAVPGAGQQEDDVSPGESSDGKSGAGESAPKKTTSQKTKKTTKTSSSANADQEDTSSTTSDESDPEKLKILQMAQQLCDHLAALMVGNGCKRPTVTKKWLDDARLMITNDEREPREAWKLIGWCQRDPFWSGNIHSMTKFRAQYDKLRQRANGAVVAAGPPRQEFKSAAEKKREHDEHETQRYRIADKLAEQRGIRITQLPWGSPEREAFWAEVDQIHQEMLHTRRQSGYTNGDVIDAEVIQPTVPEVTA